MNIFERPIHVSINRTNRSGNGIIWSTENGVVERIPFLIDKPYLVRKGLNPTTFNRVIRQIRSMGITPDTIELHVGDVNYVYDAKQYRNKVGIPMSVKGKSPEPVKRIDFLNVF